LHQTARDRILAPELALGRSTGRLPARRGEQAEREPRKCLHLATATVETKPTIPDRFLERNVGQPYLGEHTQIGFHEKVDIESRLAVAQVDDPVLENQPVMATTDRDP